jgi:hypothetical protein
MSSILRRTANTKSALTKFTLVDGPCYTDSGLGISVLFPFTYSNGVLDININPAANSFEANMINVITGNAPDEDNELLVKQMGGLGLVRALGPNFVAYIRAWRNATIDAGSPVSVYIPGVVTKVQQAPASAMEDGGVYEVSTVAPVSDEYITGNPANNYLTSWVFKKPLTITTVEGGVLTYITLRTAFDED